MTMMIDAMESNDFDMVTELLEDPGDVAVDDDDDDGFTLDAFLSKTWTPGASLQAKPAQRYALTTHAWEGVSEQDSHSEPGKEYLSFPAGARIEISELGEAGGWWKGKLGGKVGWFPSPYARLVSSAAVAVATDSWDSTGMGGEAAGYLSFEEGAHIEVVEEGEPGGWWKGMVGGKTGWYPASFTKVEASGGGTTRRPTRRSTQMAAEAWMEALEEVEEVEAAVPARKTATQLTEDAWLSALQEIVEEGERIGETARAVAQAPSSEAADATQAAADTTQAAATADWQPSELEGSALGDPIDSVSLLASAPAAASAGAEVEQEGGGARMVSRQHGADKSPWPSKFRGRASPLSHPHCRHDR